jgi:hypothetical protein
MDFSYSERRDAFLGVALSAEFLASPRSEHDGHQISIGGAGVHAALCGVWQGPWLSVEPAFGVWLRSLAVEGEGDAAAHFESARFTLVGWSMGGTVRAQLGGPWSLFAGVLGVVPFGHKTFVVTELQPAEPEPSDAGGAGPFFNSEGPVGIVGTPLPPERLEVHEVPIVTTVLLAGVTFSP